MGVKRVVLHVDRLVLQGIDIADRERVVADLEASVVEALSRPQAAGRLTGLSDRAVLRASLEAPADEGTTGKRRSSLGSAAGSAVARALIR